jgi:5-methylcytosine-specific restriction protein A
MCKAEGRITPANTCDHVTPHGGDPEKFWVGPFQSLCAAHHNSDKQREDAGFGWRVGSDGWPTDPRHHINGGKNGVSADYEELRFPSDLMPSRIPLTIICGPPGSGKSTYLRNNIKPEDIVIDLDAIMSSLSGLAEHNNPKRWINPALNVRNRMLRSLASNERHRAAWFVIAAPNPRERTLWAQRLGGKLLVMTTPLIECVRRIQADPARIGHDRRMIEAATNWWRMNPHLTSRPVFDYAQS